MTEVKCAVLHMGDAYYKYHYWWDLMLILGRLVILVC